MDGITLIFNNFHAYKDAGGDWALMHRTTLPFAPRKPAFGRQKNKDQNQRTEGIPLPSVPFVSPQKNFLNRFQQK